MSDRIHERIHASCVSLDGAGIVLTGASGSGKSDLALRLIDRGGLLVADDQLILSVKDDRLYGEPVAGFAGMIEVRGIGLVKLEVADIPVHLTHHFELRAPPERLPAPRTRTFLGIALPSWQIDAHAPSAALKVALAIGGGLSAVP